MIFYNFPISLHIVAIFFRRFHTAKPHGQFPDIYRKLSEEISGDISGEMPTPRNVWLKSSYRKSNALEFLDKKHIKFDQGLDFLSFNREINP